MGTKTDQVVTDGRRKVMNAFTAGDELEALVKGILKGQRYEDLYAIARHLATERGIKV